MAVQRKPSHPKTLARRCAELMLSKKAKDVVMLDIRGLTDISDFFVICSADSDTQLRAVADAVSDGMAKVGIKPWRSEGWQGGQWIIIDFVEVVCHILYKDAREFYKIERLWSDAKVEKLSDDDVVAKTDTGATLSDELE